MTRKWLQGESLPILPGMFGRSLYASIRHVRSIFVCMNQTLQVAESQASIASQWLHCKVSDTCSMGRCSVQDSLGVPSVSNVCMHVQDILGSRTAAQHALQMAATFNSAARAIDRCNVKHSQHMQRFSDLSARETCTLPSLIVQHAFHLAFCIANYGGKFDPSKNCSCMHQHFKILCT